MISVKVLKFLPYIITVVLFCIPFIWLEGGEVDIGGDSTRLYFYDPYHYIFNHTMYGVSPSGFGGENLSFIYLPFTLLLLFLKSFMHSPTFLISFFNGLKLSVWFLSFFLIFGQFLYVSKNDFKQYERKQLAAIVGALFFVFSPSSIYGWDKAILSHDKIFIYPLIFYLLLLFFKTQKLLYLLLIIPISFLFSHLFSYIGFPSFFSFFPLVVLFLFFYTRIVLKKKIIFSKILIFFGLFTLVHSFHTIPQLNSLFSPGNVLSNTVFSDSAKFVRGLSYFEGIAPLIKVSLFLLNLPQLSNIQPLYFSFFIFPFLTLIGIFISKKNKSTLLKDSKVLILIQHKTLILTGFFFLIILFLVSANITYLWINIYKLFFIIPGFSMFRNFYGQWGFTYFTFFTLLFGQSLFIIFRFLPRKIFYPLSLICVSLLIVNALPFIKGDLIKPTLWKSNNVSILTKIDPSYEETLDFIRNIADDAKILSLPMADPGYQIVAGINGGAYQGPSPISYLTNKSDYVSLEELGDFKPLFREIIEGSNIKAANNFLSMLNIKYVYHNLDPYVYELGFPTFPYEEARQFLPVSQNTYKTFVDTYAGKKIYGNKNYSIYQRENFLPRFYIPKQIVNTDLAISDWNFLLSDYDISSNRTAIYFDNENIYEPPLIKARKVDIFKGLIKDYPHTVLYPPVDLKIYSPSYPFLALKEEIQLEKFKTSPDAYIDRLLFLAGKRMSELEKWGDETTLLGNIKNLEDYYNQEKNNKSIFKHYGSWESVLARSIGYLEGAIKISESLTEASQQKIKMVQIKEVILAHQNKISVIISKSNLSKGKKGYLLALVDNYYESALKKIEVREIRIGSLEYLLDKNISSDYEVYVENPRDNPVDSDVRINIGDETLVPNDSSAFSQWISFGQIQHLTPSSNFTVEIPIEKLDVSNGWVKNGVDLVPLSPSEEKKELNFKKNENIGYLKYITGLLQNTHYLISFDYLTHGSTFNMSYSYKSRNEKGEDTLRTVFSEEKNSRKSRKFNAIIDTENSKEGIFEIRTIKSSDERATIEIKNFSVVKLPYHYNILLKNKNKEFSESSIPKITYEKINPTKYKLYIKDAVAPYNLIFLNSFYKNWKVYLNEKKEDKLFDSMVLWKPIKKIIPSISEDQSYFNKKQAQTIYYNGEIVESFKNNIFFDQDIFETWSMRQIAERAHYMVNGYANSWYITPKDVENKTSYELVVELSTQRIFNFSMFLSIVGLILSGVFIIREIYFYLNA